METGNVSLTIGKDIVNPIVQAKINEAIISALGGGEAIIEKVVNEILNRKVDSKGNVSTYSSDNKFSWIDVAVTNQIKEAVIESMSEVMVSRKDEIRKAIVKQLSSQKGIMQFADALINESVKNFESKYSTSINIEFDKRKGLLRQTNL